MKPDVAPPLSPSILCPGCDGEGTIPASPLIALLLRKSVVTEDGCWEYGGNARRHYQTFTRGPLRYAVHRLAHILWVGPIEVGQVLHTCDNKRCWRPDHLYDGDSLDNNRDRRTRYATYGQAGEASHFARLTAPKVAAIRAAADARGMLPRQKADMFAAAFGVHRNTIYRAFTGQTWREDTRVKPEPREHWARR